MAAFQQSRTEVKYTSLSVVKTAVHAGALDSKPLYSFQETKEQAPIGAASAQRQALSRDLVELISLKSFRT